MRRRRDQRNPGLRMAQASDLGGRFMARQLPTLTRFRALRHLDLQLVRESAVLRGDPEAPRGYLFDAGIPVERRAPGSKPCRVLAALPGVALAPQPVHRNGDRL